jgi:hypothetical protein
MVDDRPVNFDMESAMLIKQTVNAHLKKIRNKVHGSPRTSRRSSAPIYHVVADEAIAAATDSFTTPGLGVATIWRLDSEGELQETTEKVDVVNRNTSVSYALGDYFEVELRSSEWIPLVAGGGGAATGSCSACCISVASGNMLHPDLTAGYDETTREWTLIASCGGDLEPISIPSDDGTLLLTWPGGSPVLTYEGVGDTFTLNIAAACTITNAAGTDVTGSTSYTASITMDWATTGTITFLWAVT